MKESTIYIFLLIIIYLGGYGLVIYQHERVHQEIYRFNGIDSSMEFGLSKAQVVTDGTKECNDSCHLAHSINESITYPLQAVYLIAGALFITKEMFKYAGR